MKPTISIFGCGWLGEPLAQHLLANRFKVKASTTSEEKLNRLKSKGIDAFQLQLELLDDTVHSFLNADILVVNIPSKNTNGFNNGITTLTPDFLYGPGDPIHYKPNVSKKISVCNINLCTGQKICKDYYIKPPAPCTNNLSLSNYITITPNPNQGEFQIDSENEITGEYSIFDIYGNIISNGKFLNSKSVAINITGKAKKDIYFVVVKTGEFEIKETIILK